MIGREFLYYVDDFEAAVKLYRDGFGFKLVNRYDFGFAVLDAGGPAGIVAIMDKKNFGANPPLDPEPTPRMSLKTEDIEAEVASLKARGVTVSEIRGKESDWRWATFVDADGGRFFLWEGDET